MLITRRRPTMPMRPFSCCKARPLPPDFIATDQWLPNSPELNPRLVSHRKETVYVCVCVV